MKIDVCENQTIWDGEIISRGGHPLQLWGWGEVKAAHGWKAERVFVRDGTIIGAAQILLRPLPGPLKYFAYIPRGPVAAKEVRGDVLEVLADYVKKKYGAVTLSVEPDWEKMPDVKGWHRTNNTVMIPRTLILDLSLSEDELMNNMHSKTRWSIRRAERNGVTVRQIKTKEELADCLELYKQTAQRAQFALHDDQYYYDISDKLREHSSIFAAYHQDTLIAFSWSIVSESVGFALYAGSTTEGQQLRANYLLKWHEIKTMKKWGVKQFDFNGLLNDGISNFKRSFAQHETMLAGTYDKPLSPLYLAWSRGLPLAKKVVRIIKR